MISIDTIVLAVGGRGSRLDPLTRSCPKCLLPLGDKPILCRLLDRVLEAEFARVILLTGYLHDAIEQYIAHEYLVPPRSRTRIETLFNEGRTTIQATTWLYSLISNPFVYSDGDILYPTHLLTELVTSHRQSGCSLTVTASPLHRAATHLQVWPAESGTIQYIEQGLEGRTGPLCGLGILVVGQRFAEFLSGLDRDLSDLDYGVANFFRSGNPVNLHVYSQDWVAIHTARDLSTEID